MASQVQTDPCASADGFQPGVTDVALCEATGVAPGLW